MTMSESLVDEFELFLLDLPANVRDDLSFMMIMLSDEDLDIHDPAEVYDLASKGLFKTATSFGRMGNLIYAVSVLDIYFAMNVRGRFGSGSLQKRPNALPAKVFSGPYAREVEAIRTAKQRWAELRVKKFTPKKLAAALTPLRDATAAFPKCCSIITCNNFAMTGG
jgi:hypothetical protein